MTFSGEDLEGEAHPRKEASSLRGRKAPELSLEWRDVTIQIRYCAGPDDEEQEFVELFPKVKILIPPIPPTFWKNPVRYGPWGYPLNRLFSKKHSQFLHFTITPILSFPNPHS